MDALVVVCHGEQFGGIGVRAASEYVLSMSPNNGSTANSVLTKLCCDKAKHSIKTATRCVMVKMAKV
jgi:hypothetical protein